MVKQKTIDPKMIEQADQMTVTIARLLEDEEKIFHGVSSQLPMVSILLAKAMHAKNLTYINIPGGVNPTPNQLSDYSSAGHEQYFKSDAVFSLQDVFDLSMRGKLDVAFLSGVQFDKLGNVNASVIGDYHNPKVRLPGGAGSAVLIPTVKKAIIWRSKHDIRTFVNKVDFVTTRGNIYKIVTPLGMFKYENGQLDIEAISPYTTIEEVVQKTGFPISQSNVKVLEPPSSEELRWLQRIDPKGLRFNEFV
jgi:glutaconate CoA-transferase subunit B